MFPLVEIVMKSVAYCSFALFFGLVLNQSVPQSSEALTPARPIQTEQKFEPLDQLMFFAVSEGLYREGVANEDVDIILTQVKGENGELGYMNFVYGCGLCTPSLNAFRNYRQRLPFYGSKTHGTNFGKGLRKDDRAKLRGEKPQERLDCLQGMIRRWVKERLDRKRLTAAEKQHFQLGLAQLRKEAMVFLKDSQSPYASTTKCAVCEGAVSSSK